jgi:hypothetical protein
VSITLLILSALVPIGALDELYYHLYRFRLYRQAQSVLEEVTHLVRQLAFVVVVALLASGVTTPLVDGVVLGLLVLDFFNSALDVALEPSSRAHLGGVPPGEYFLHFLGSVGAGAASVSYLYERVHLPIAPASGLLGWQSALAVIGGSALFLLELALFLRAVVRRRALRASPTSVIA